MKTICTTQFLFHYFRPFLEPCAFMQKKKHILMIVAISKNLKCLTGDIMNVQTEDIIHEDTKKLLFYFSSKHTLIRFTIFLRDVYRRRRAIKV